MRDVGLIVVSVHNQAGSGEASIDEVRAVLDLFEASLHGSAQLVEVGGGEVANGP
ncbi:hypothetical protein GCM10010336_51670 [Streptomyces goshikiensis]|nr:hypothetical protein GCM10010336_51670 [Streptomyces goshikiensis]